MPTIRKVVLFDIDGTLLLSNGAGRTAMEAALVAIFGTAGPKDHRYDGKTDKLIVREAMSLEGFTDADIDARMDEVMARYLTGLRENLAGQRPAYALAGVMPLLDAIARDGALMLGLLTGNIVEGAQAKLASARIGTERFTVGAYGSDHEERPMLPPVARERASALLGRDLRGDQLVIIGDTPADVQCGRGIDARAIAVASGGYSVAELEEHRPAATFADLSDTARVLAAIHDA